LPAAEAVLLGLMGMTSGALFWFFRRERLRLRMGMLSETGPIRLGLIRGCAFVLVLVVTYMVVAMFLTALTHRPG